MLTNETAIEGWIVEKVGPRYYVMCSCLVLHVDLPQVDSQNFFLDVLKFL